MKEAGVGAPDQSGSNMNSLYGSTGNNGVVGEPVIASAPQQRYEQPVAGETAPLLPPNSRNPVPVPNPSVPVPNPSVPVGAGGAPMPSQMPMAPPGMAQMPGMAPMGAPGMDSPIGASASGRVLPTGSASVLRKSRRKARQQPQAELSRAQ